MKIEGKEAVNENGTYLGKIVGYDAHKGKLFIQSIFDKRYSVAISTISAVEERVVLKLNE